eukprot:253019_1
MITCVTWIPSNVAKEWPDKVHEIPIKNLPIHVDDMMYVEPEILDEFLKDDSDNENEDIDNKNTNNKRKFNELENVDSDNQKNKKQKTNDYNNNDSDENNERLADIDDPDKFTEKVLEGYDEDEPLDFLSRIAGLQSGIGIGPLDYSEGKENDSELEDIHIKPTDEIFICLGCDYSKESSTMQLYVFDTQLRTFYSHHDITLPSFPLCCKWLSNNNYGTNLLAIGSVEESIEIFNLDVMDALQPICSLGGRISNQKGLKLLSKWNENIGFNYMEMDSHQKEMTLGKLKPGSHSDAVLCLDWNKINESYLFSGSADNCVKLWDINKQKCINTMSDHTDKVQQIKLKPTDANMLISGGFDKQLFLYDIKYNKNEIKYMQTWNVVGEVETITWHPMNDNLFIVSLDNGYIQCFDIRKNINKCLWYLKGHKKAVTSLCFNNNKMDLFVTGSLDKKIKIWYQESSEKKPILLSEQSNHATGGIFSIDFAPKRFISDILIIGGHDNFGMFDIQSDPMVNKFYETNNDSYVVNNDGNNKYEMGNEHQHYIMEQTFNYKKGKEIVISNDNTINDFLEDD